MTKKKKRIRLAIFLCALAGLILLLGRLPESEQTPQTEPTQPETVPVSNLEPTDFEEKDGFLTCLAGESVVGIDVSHHQQDIDWQQVKASGVEFVMVRLGYRGITEGDLHTDEYALANLAGAKAAGLSVGAYFFSQAVTVEEAEQEAAYALEILGDFPLDLPLAFDWEIEARTETVDRQTATDCARAFCETVEEAGCQSMIYFNSYQAKQRLDLLQLTDYPWWLAMYDAENAFPCRFDIWQYTSAGIVAGIQGNVDLNVLIKN